MSPRVQLYLWSVGKWFNLHIDCREVGGAYEEKLQCRLVDVVVYRVEELPGGDIRLALKFAPRAGLEPMSFTMERRAKMQGTDYDQYELLTEFWRYWGGTGE